MLAACLLIVFALPEAKAEPASNQTGAEFAKSDKRHLQTGAKEGLPFQIAGKASRTVQSLTGITWLSEVIAGRLAGLAIHRKVGGKVKVKVKTWSLTDCLAGKIKSVDVRTKGSAVKGVPVGNLHLYSTTPIWLRYRRQDNEKAGLRRPIVLSLEGQISAKNLEVLLESDKLNSQLRALKLDLPGLGEQRLQILSPSLTMTQDLLKISGVLVTAGASADTGVPMTVTGNLRLQGNDRIVLENMKVEAAELFEPERFAAFLEQLLNPLVNLGRFDRSDLALRLNTLRVLNGSVLAEGTVLLAPRRSGCAVSAVAVK